MIAELRLPPLTLGYLTIDCKPLETLDVAADAGFRSAGIRITGRRVGGAYAPIVGNAAAAREIRLRAERNRVRISNVSAYHLYPDLDERELEGVCAATAGVGCDTVIVNNYDEDRDRFVRTMVRYGAIARRHGLRLALEFVSFSATKSLGEALDAIDRAGLDNIGLMADILHLDRSGGTPSDLAQVDPSRIFIAQICDGPAERPRDREGLLQEARYGRQYPGDGALPLRSFIEALPPGCELEAELPIVESTNLPPLLKAQIARCRTERFLLDTIVASFVSRRQSS